jgi:regulator of sirC expression with transglutaminase-like and TPR domain
MVYRPLEPLDYFGLLVADAASIPLFEAAASIAQDAYPELALQEVQAAFDRLAQALSQDCRGASDETGRLQRALQSFYVDRGFAGNARAYYDPDNSYLHRVMETRLGIPISLAVLLGELLRHLGLDARGVAFPGHFLLRVDLHDGVVIIDPFDGRSLSAEEVERRAAPYGGRVDRLLRPASSRQVLARMLANLRAIHDAQGESALVAKIDERLRRLQSRA